MSGIMSFMLGLFKKSEPNNIIKEVSSPEELLSAATAAKKDGNLEAAISLLKKAYESIAATDDSYRVETFLRLPLYLQEAGRKDEAWNEFQKILTNGYPNQSGLEYPELVPMANSAIYDKMRLFLQREGRNGEAVKYGLFSHLSWSTGLYLQKRRDEFKDYITSESIDYIVLKLLKKANKTDLLIKISKLIKHEIRNIPNIDFEALGSKVDREIIS